MNREGPSPWGKDAACLVPQTLRDFAWEPSPRKSALQTGHVTREGRCSIKRCGAEQNIAPSEAGKLICGADLGVCGAARNEQNQSPFAILAVGSLLAVLATHLISSGPTAFVDAKRRGRKESVSSTSGEWKAMVSAYSPFLAHELQLNRSAERG